MADVSGRGAVEALERSFCGGRRVGGAVRRSGPGGRRAGSGWHPSDAREWAKGRGTDVRDGGRALAGWVARFQAAVGQ
jgi:hypothetical protein